ncbi:MAG TPA: HD domain-containing phosphohydrolase [Longimicrobiaceae bacterium]|nr:HD domain-containing phosphohydrolase [Longimicrobiaceae bacterium]
MLTPAERETIREVCAEADRAQIAEGISRIAARLRAVGVVAVRSTILHSRRSGSEIERLMVVHHAAAGAWLLKDAGYGGAMVSTACSHHKRWDGLGGYPDGRAGEAIPLWARVLAVADTIDAMSYPRPYRPGLRWSVVVAELERCRGNRFDPLVAGVALGMLEELEGIREGYARPMDVAAFRNRRRARSALRRYLAPPPHLELRCSSPSTSPHVLAQDNVTTFVAMLRRLARPGVERLVLNFAHTDQADTAALRALVRLRAQLLAERVDLAVMNLPPKLRKQFDRLDLLTRLPLAASSPPAANA